MKRALVVIGNGMAGARFVEELLRRDGIDRFDITVIGEEPHGNYNRILLSSVLAGQHEAADIVINTHGWYAAANVQLLAGVRATKIDLETREVVSGGETRTPFDVLVIATGSRPVMPPIDGLFDGDALKRGAFVFRTLDDCERIVDCAGQARRVVVVGGGLLGLEAARGLLGRRLHVDVVHLASHVMESQLDAQGGRLLQQQLEALGIRVHLQKLTIALLGSDAVTGVALDDGTTIDADMVVVATGVRPDVAIAADAGLLIRRGIVVGEDLACRGAADVYAIGECAEHDGQLYGLVAPLWEQACVLADRLSGRRPDARYTGSRVSTRLKVAGVDLAVMGIKDAERSDDEVVSYVEPSRGVYKKLVVRGNRLAGAIVMGDGAIVPSVLQAFTESAVLAPNRAELLFPGGFENPLSLSVDRLPDSAQVCDCNAVAKGAIVQAALEGAATIRAIGECTRAGTGCGSCRPEIQALLDHVRPAFDAPADRPLAERSA